MFIVGTGGILTHFGHKKFTLVRDLKKSFRPIYLQYGTGVHVSLLLHHGFLDIQVFLRCDLLILSQCVYFIYEAMKLYVIRGKHLYKHYKQYLHGLYIYNNISSPPP